MQSPGAAGGSFSPTPTDAEPSAVCPPATPGRYQCESILVPTATARAEAETQYLLGSGPAPAASPSYEGSGEGGGFSPRDLRSAYDLAGTGGEGRTVAIVDAYDDPDAESDLATYRRTYGLSACTSESGCFEKVNQDGEPRDYPSGEAGWAVEISLDLDMVSAVCPSCHILLVEADSNETEDLGSAVQEAAQLGASVISDSWSGEEFPEESSFDHYLEHPGVPVLFASGDEGYGAQYPAASPDVVAVGGTSLTKAKNARGWSESAWSGAGSGCSAFEPKPAWQSDEECPRRTVADIAAVADPSTPVSIYDTYEHEGWLLAGGTSVATPLVAAVEALSTSAFRAAGPSAIYDAGEAGELFDVSEGENGGCGTYLCQAEAGYDGPTGWGTPDGPLSLPVAITQAATVDPSGDVTLHGSVDPKGVATEYRFEYGETTSYGTSVPLTGESAGSGTEYLRVSQPIEGVKPRTTYHYRILATNAEGTFAGADRSFGTTAPAVSTLPARRIHEGKATLDALVDPEGLSTTYYFEYGTSPAYGEKMPLRSATLGSAATGTTVSTALSGLVGDQVYHFRVVAKNLAGTTYGKDETFTAKPAEWSAQAFAQPGDSSDEQKGEAVSCVQPQACVAVGDYWSLALHTFAPLAEIWNGQAWSVMSTPYPPGLEEGWKEDRYYALLAGVSCPSESDCLAVGYYRGAGTAVEPLAERLEGDEWTMLPVAAPSGAAAGWLTGVSCVSATSCIAVGYDETSAGAKQALAERWDGSEWSLEPTPEPAGASGASLAAVSCASSAGCTAVGSYETAAGVRETLAERWEGGEFSIQATPDPSGTEASNTLAGVSCSSATSCMAIGTHLYKASVGRSTEAPLGELWDGSEWSVLSFPAGGSKKGTDLAGVSCASASACTAVGIDSDGKAGAKLLGERWNGTAWHRLKTVGPTEPADWWQETWLTGISCAQADACTAVGNNLSAPKGGLSYWTGFGEQEFIGP